MKVFVTSFEISIALERFSCEYVYGNYVLAKLKPLMFRVCSRCFMKQLQEREMENLQIWAKLQVQLLSAAPRCPI